MNDTKKTQPPDPSSALANVPTADRGGAVAVNSAQATEQELDAFLDALKHPPQKPDVISTLVSCLSAGLLIANTLSSAHRDNSGSLVISSAQLTTMMIAGGLLAAIVLRFITQLFQKHPTHIRALGYVEHLMKAAQSGAKPPNTTI